MTIRNTVLYSARRAAHDTFQVFSLLQLCDLSITFAYLTGKEISVKTMELAMPFSMSSKVMTGHAYICGPGTFL